MRDSWREITLAEFTSIQKGKISKQSETSQNGYLPIINTDYLRGKIKVWGKINGSVTCEKDDLLILWDGERSGLCAIGNEGIVGSTFAKIKVNDNLFPDYLFRFIDFNFEWIQGQRTGTGVPHVPKNLNSIFKIYYPPLPQQKKIAQILSACDTVLEKTESAIAKYQALKQGMLHDLFTRGIDITTGKLRPKYEEAPELYKETELGFVPREWEKSTFGEKIDKNLYGPRFSAADYDENGNVRTIRGMDFSKDGGILYNQTPIALLPITKVNSHLLIENDVVMVTTADCGLTAVFEEQNFKFIPSAYSVKFRFNEEVNPYFIKFYMQTESAKRQVNKYVRQGTLGNLPGSDVLDFILNLPSRKEQDIIVNRIMILDQKIHAEQQTLAKYVKLKAGLMQDLLSGVVGVEGLVDL